MEEWIGVLLLYPNYILDSMLPHRLHVSSVSTPMTVDSIEHLEHSNKFLRLKLLVEITENSKRPVVTQLIDELEHSSGVQRTPVS